MLRFDEVRGRLSRALDELESAKADWRRLHPADDPASPEQRAWFRQLEALVYVVPRGLGYAATGAEGIHMTLTRLRESRGDLSAELSVTRHGVHLYQARMNLTSGTARASTSKLLKASPGGAGVDWDVVLEQLCLQTLAAERAGDPVEHVGTREPLPAPPRVIDPFLPEAATLVWAPQGVGKSTLAAGVVVSLELWAHVIPGWHPTKPRKCLVLDWEASPSEWNDRIRAITLGLEDDVEPPSVAYRRMRQPLADAVESIAEIRDRLGIGYLVIDSVEKAAGAKADSGTYEEKAERLFLALDRLAIPSLLIDHVAGEDFRGGASKVTPKSIGSVLKGAWARATYDLKRDPETSTEARTEMVLHNVKVNDAARQRPYEFALVYDSEHGQIRFEQSRLSSPELLRSLPLAERLWRHLASVGRAQLVKELAAELDTTPGTIRDLLSRDEKSEHRRFVRLLDNTVGLRMQTSADDA